MHNLHYARYMDISLFKDLGRLKQTGNFTQAAVLANLSQPAFSRRIKSLETWVGTTLVDRSNQPVHLTAAGLQMLEAGEQALALIEGERSQILEAQSLPDKYVVTFGVQHSIGWRFYPAWLYALEDAFGPILSRLRADDLPNCMEDLRKGNADFAIAYSDRGDRADDQGSFEPLWFSGLETIVIGQDVLIPVCKANGQGEPIFDMGGDAVEMPFLRFGDAAPIGKHLQPMFRKYGLSSSFRTVYENTMAGALRIRAQAGDGVAWLPHSLVEPDLKSGLLCRTGDRNWDVKLNIRLLRNKNHTNRLTRAIWTLLEVRKAAPLVAPPGGSQET